MVWSSYQQGGEALFRIITYDWLTVSREEGLFASVDLVVGDRVIFFGELWSLAPAVHRLLLAALKGHLAVLDFDEVSLDEVLFPCGWSQEQMCPRLADFSVRIEGNEVVLADFYHISNHFPETDLEEYVLRKEFRMPYVKFASEVINLAEQVKANLQSPEQIKDEDTERWTREFCQEISSLVNRVKMKMSGYHSLREESDPVFWLLQGEEERLVHFLRTNITTGIEQALNPILQLLHDPNEAKRFLGVKFFQKVQGRLMPIKNRLVEMLGDSSPAVRYAAIRALEKAPYAQIVPPILELFCTMEQSHWPLLRDVCAMISKYLGQRQLQLELIELLAEGSDLARRRILFLLSEKERTFPIFRRPLINLLKDPDCSEEVLHWAGTVLSRYPGREVDRVFADIVESEGYSWEMRQQCTAYLPRTKKNVQMLNRLLYQTDVPLTFLCAVIEQLGVIGGEEVIDQLFTLTEKSGWPEEVRRTTIWTIFSLIDGGDSTKVYDILGHRINLGVLAEEPRITAETNNLTMTTKQRSQWVLLKILLNRQEAEIIRGTVAGCLDRLTNPDLVRILLRLVQDSQEKYLVRANALHALERIMEHGDFTPLKVLQEMSKSFSSIQKGLTPVPMYSANGNFDSGVAFAILLEAVIARIEANRIIHYAEEAKDGG